MRLRWDINFYDVYVQYFVKIWWQWKNLDKYQLLLTNPHNALHYGNVLQTKMDAQCDKFVTEIS